MHLQGVTKINVFIAMHVKLDGNSSNSFKN